jgi:protein involved in polysaccharide export with SLBB domain
MLKKFISFCLIITLLFSLIPKPIFAEEYILAPQDTIELQVINDKTLNTKQTIAPDGTISLGLVGRIKAEGQSLSGLQIFLEKEYTKYIKAPQIVLMLEPRPIYIVWHDISKNTWEVKTAKSITEAKALAGKNYTGEIKYGDTINIEISQEKDWFEANWYKVLTATAVVVGIYGTVHR